MEGLHLDQLVLLYAMVSISRKGFSLITTGNKKTALNRDANLPHLPLNPKSVCLASKNTNKSPIQKLTELNTA